MFIFEVALDSFIDMYHELVLLSKKLDWETELAEFYCARNGGPSVSIRKMMGMMLLKNIYNLGDEGVVARWTENPYMLYFTDEKVFRLRAGVGPVIGHPKSDYRLMRNYRRATFLGTSSIP